MEISWIKRSTFDCLHRRHERSVGEPDASATGGNHPTGNRPLMPSFKAMTRWLTWSLLSALFAAATAILAKLGVSGVDANVATADANTPSVVVLFTWILASHDSPAKQFSGIFQPHLAVSGAFRLCNRPVMAVLFSCATGGSSLASRAHRQARQACALVILFAAMFLGERLTWSKGVGGLLIVAGAVVLALD